MTDTLTPPPATSSANPRLRVTGPRVVLSEWTKFRSLRSTLYTLLLAVVFMVGLGALISAITANQPGGLEPGQSAISASLSGIFFAQLAIGVLGVLLISGEYGTGMIRSSLTAPRRLPVVWAKALVLGVVTLLLSEIASFVGFFIGQATLGTHSVAFSADGALRAVIGTGLYLTVVAVIGVALGFIIRSTAGGIAALVGILLVLPGVVSILPQTWQDNIGPYLPSTAGAALYDLHPEAGSLDPWTGFGVFCLYAVVGLIAGAFVLNRRDA